MGLLEVGEGSGNVSVREDFPGGSTDQGLDKRGRKIGGEGGMAVVHW